MLETLRKKPVYKKTSEGFDTLVSYLLNPSNEPAAKKDKDPDYGRRDFSVRDVKTKPFTEDEKELHKVFLHNLRNQNKLGDMPEALRICEITRDRDLFTKEVIYEVIKGYINKQDTEKVVECFEYLDREKITYKRLDHFTHLTKTGIYSGVYENLLGKKIALHGLEFYALGSYYQKIPEKQSQMAELINKMAVAHIDHRYSCFRLVDLLKNNQTQQLMQEWSALGAWIDYGYAKHAPKLDHRPFVLETPQYKKALSGLEAEKKRQLAMQNAKAWKTAKESPCKGLLHMIKY